MLTIQGRNVNETYYSACSYIQQYSQDVAGTRAGDAVAFPYPVVTVTENPMERVLFCRTRRANPFFHFFECLWMISGMSDGKWLDRFVGDFSSRFGEPESGNIWGAYGWRWRDHFEVDQLENTIRVLKTNPDDRRVVIAMWDPTHDINSKTHTDSGQAARDLPCNTHMYPRIVDGRLDLSICVRSNDIVWGCYGANAVHLSFVQEYLAGMIGVPVGRMYQFSNNLHVYTDLWDKIEGAEHRDYYSAIGISPYPIMTVPEFWDGDCLQFLTDPTCDPLSFHNEWFTEVVQPMWQTHALFKKGEKNLAYEASQYIEAEDWRRAVQEWLNVD